MEGMERYFESSVPEIIRREIERSGGNEVLFFAWTGEDNRVVKVQAVARGTDECVAVPLERSFLPDVLIHNHPDGRLVPSDNDMRIASFTAGRGVGFFIVDNEAGRLYVAVEPVLKRGLKPLDVEKLAALIGAGGPFARSFPGFEEREGQKEMVRRVALSFNQDSVALIEAGTGIGKSVAYLIPSIEWALLNRERVVVSTHTIHLQEQLIGKDIPDLKRALGLDFSHVLMKGRNNYVCLNKVAEIRQDLFSFLDDEEIEQFDHITRWLEVTGDGSLSDFDFVPKAALWEKINSSSETCLGGGCGLFGRCFVNRVKRRAITAHLVVTNHHYLLADASLARSGSSILPAYERIVLDEAHNLEDSASSFFTKTVTRAGILRLLGRLYSDGKRKRGYLAFLEKQGFCEGEERHERLRREVQRVKSSAGELFDGIEDLLAALGRSGGGPEGSPGGSSFGQHPVAEMGDELLEHPLWESGVCGFLMTCRADIGTLAGSLIELMELLDRKGEERAQKQLGGFVARLGDIVKAFDIFTRRNDPPGTGRSGDGSNGAEDEEVGGGHELVRHGDEGWDEAAPSGRGEYARWLEKRKDAALVVSLVDVGAMLKNLLFKRAKSTVLTSATLAVGGNFRFIRSRLTLDGEADEAVLPSPFQYDRQMGILIPNDMVGPDHPGYVPAMASGVVQVLKKTQGKAFVLFTSYRTLNEVFEMAKGELSSAGFVTFKQGSDSRMILLDRFKRDIHSILFGTESFWEGVDVPGEALECVIITKLPFRVPTEPVEKERLERIKEMGGDPFLEYSLPQAVMKMKQGMGRLIRNRTDRGIVVILDKRIRTKRYGEAFIEAMPGGRLLEGPLARILEESGEYLSR